MRPSLEQSTSKPFFLPSSVTAVSTMLSLPSLRFTTSCSKPEDLVKTRRDFFGAEADRCESAKLAVAAVSVAVVRGRRNSRGSERGVMGALHVDECRFVHRHHTTESATGQEGCARIASIWRMVRNQTGNTGL